MVYRYLKNIVQCPIQKFLDKIYKFFIQPHLDYGAIIFYQPENEFLQKIESVQYNAGLAITGAIQGASREKGYKELSLKTLKSRR